MSKKTLINCCAVGLVVSAVSVAVTGTGFFACCIAMILLLFYAKYRSDTE